MARERQRLVVYHGDDTGYGGVFYAVRALGPEPEVSWCEHTDGCEKHHLLGRHLAIDVSRGTPRVGRADGTVRQDVQVRSLCYGSLVVRDFGDMAISQIGLLSAADAIVLVVDRQRPHRFYSLQRRVEWLKRDLTMLGRDPRRVPIVFQLERSDLDPYHRQVDERAMPRSVIDWMLQWVGPHAFVESVAYRREGIHEALDEALAMLDALPQQPQRDPPAHSRCSRDELLSQWGLAQEVSQQLLDDVRELLSKPSAAALPALLELWCEHRYPKLGAIIERLTLEQGPHEPVDAATFDDLVKLADPSDLPQLLASLTTPHTRRHAERIAKLEAFVPDPRITNACFRWLSDFNRFRRAAVLDSITQLLIANSDPLSLVALELFLADCEGNIPPPFDHRDGSAYLAGFMALSELQESFGASPAVAKLPEQDRQLWHDAAKGASPRHEVMDLCDSHAEQPLTIADGVLHECAIRVTNLRRLRELTGHEAWATLKRMRWGSDRTVRERFIDTDFVLHPVMRTLETLGGLTLETIDSLLDRAPLPFTEIETERIVPDQFDDIEKWPALTKLSLVDEIPEALSWLPTSPIAARLVELLVCGPLESLSGWLELVDSGLPALRRLTLRRDHDRLVVCRGPDGWALDEADEAAHPDLAAQLAAVTARAAG